MNSLRLGTRGSRLALWQAEYVAARLKQAWPDIDIPIITIKTKGDKILDVALSKIGDKGLFTKEIEYELLKGNIDVAVHSLKDLPSFLTEGLCLGAVLTRENPGDVLISHKGYRFQELPPGAVLGTSSLRRISQVKRVRPDMQIVELRGNVETRIKKMEEQGLDGIILAYAGVKRLGFADRITDYLPSNLILPAVGQGIIGMEIRQDDEKIKGLLARINDQPTYTEALAERAFLQELQGGCQVPIASLAELKNGQLEIRGLVASLDGRQVFMDRRKGPGVDAEKIGRDLACQLLQSGAGEILKEIRQLGEI